MHKCINFRPFLRTLFDDASLVRRGSAIITALLDAQSPRISSISEKMPGGSSAGYKTVQRFLKQVDLKQTLLRFFQEEAEFVIGDPTQMPRYKAPKTSYVGKLNDGKTPGYWLFVLSTPFRGRAIPFWFVTYSSRTLREELTSRNQEHFRCLGEIHPLLGERPVVFDREFCYRELMELLTLEQIQFVIRLNLGDQKRQPRIVNAEGQPIKLFIRPGEMVVHRNVYYLGQVKVHLIGHWRKSLYSPLWVMTTLEPERGLEIYQKRMKIEETFRDCKDLLHLTKLMNKQHHYLEQMIALSLIAYVAGVWLGEALRDATHGQVELARIASALLEKPRVDPNLHPKWLLYSGLFVLLKQKLRLSAKELRQVTEVAADAFATMVQGNVRSFV